MVSESSILTMILLIDQPAIAETISVQDIIEIISIFTPGETASSRVKVLMNMASNFDVRYSTTNIGNLHAHIMGASGVVISLFEFPEIDKIAGAIFVEEVPKSLALSRQREIIDYVEQALGRKTENIMGKPGFRFTTTEPPHVFFVGVYDNCVSLTQCYEDEAFISLFQTLLEALAQSL